jgi:hypothetical protein
MPYKAVPQDKNRQKLRIPVQGSPTITSSPSSFTNSRIQGCKYVNCFPVEIPMFGGEPQHIVNKAPGFDTASNTINVNQAGSLGAIGWNTMGQIVQYFDQDAVFVATKGSTNNVYAGQIFTSNNLVPELNLGTDQVTSPLCKIYNQASGVNVPYYAYVTTTGVGFNITLINTSAWTSVTNSYTVAGTGVLSAVPPIYMNNRMFFLDVSTGLIYNTDPINGTGATYTTGSLIPPQIVADKYFGMVKYRNHLCVIGEYSIEFFYDAGLGLGSPLARQEQYLIRHGCTSISNVFMYGDIMYFLGLSDTQGWGLYEVANFNLRKVSPPGIDAILNNIDDYTGQASPQVSINLIDVFGHAVLLFQFQNYSGANTVQFVFEIPKRPYGIMAPTDGQWWEWPATSAIPQGQAHYGFAGPSSIFSYPLIFHTLPHAQVGAVQGTPIVNNLTSSPYNAIPASFYFTYPTNTTTIPVFFSKNRAVSSSTTGTIITDVMDFEENLEKHVDYIDCVGDFGNNTITLSWTNDPTYQSANWVTATTKNQSTAGPKNVVRWHNPGPFRQMALRYDFTGTSNIVYKGTEVSFNMGTR